MRVAVAYMENAAKNEVKEEKEYGREFQETAHLSQFISIVSQYNEHVEFEVLEKEIL